MTSPGAAYRDFVMPEPLAPSARAWLDRPDHPRLAPRLSASVLLLRDGARGIEVFVQRRSSTMAFAPDVLAYPGGGVDPRDTEDDLEMGWVGPQPSVWADRLGMPQPQARQVVLAAVRELFEECGVLLAGDQEGELVGGLSGTSWERDRSELLSRRVSLAQLLTRRRLLLRADLLCAVGRWITPECEPRRYDTVFFAAGMPSGQTADGATTESVRSRWVGAADALAECRAGTESMLPPTQVLAEQLAAAERMADVLVQRPRLHPVLPWPVEHHGSLWMRAPVDDRGHGIPTDRGPAGEERHAAGR